MRQVVLLVILGAMSGCADFKPEPFPDSKQIKEGPGLLTGPTGEWTIPIGSSDSSPSS